MLSTDKQYMQWTQNDTEYQARWLSQSGHAPPDRVVIIDDTTSADCAYRLACAGNSMLWQGDYHNARQLMQAITRRIERANARSKQRQLKKADSKKSKASNKADTIPNLFHQERQLTAQRSRLLSRILLKLDANYVSALRRAPDMSAACTAAFGVMDEPCVLSFRDLQGALGAAGWREKGVPIEALGLSIYPHYGVFAPTRHEYVQLLLDAPMPDMCDVAYDIGTGTGLLAIILAQRGAGQVIATDLNPQALACARDNIKRLQLTNIQVHQADLYPTDVPLANLIICNPPWLPAKPSSPLEYAVYDDKSAMLRGLLQGAKQHLAAHGELWLVLSDLAEHLQLRTREELLDWITNAGLKVKYRLDTMPNHHRSQDKDDPLFAARSSEMTSLWCLVSKSYEP